MERLKKSIINKSNCVVPKAKAKVVKSISSTRKLKILKIYNLSLRGGQFQPPVDDFESVFALAQKIKTVVEKLAIFLKRKELKGATKIFFKGGRLILELVLRNCNISVNYSVLTDGLSVQMILVTSTVGGTVGFIVAWFSAGAALIAPPLLTSILLLRSANQQIVNQRQYVYFKNLMNQMLKDDELTKTIRAVFVDAEGQTPVFSKLKIKLLNENVKIEFKLTSEPEQTLDEFIKIKMKEELGLVNNPTESQLKEIIRKKVKMKPKGKTILFQEFIDKIRADSSDSDLVRRNILETRIRIDPD
jgi:hypothetical protein